MSDPLAKEVSNLASLKFAKLYSPKMKSVYWKYFGFPTNEEDRIITKQNVVCTLCHRVLTNHGNTTNLRAHLQHRHKDIFHKICMDNDIKIPNRKLVNVKTGNVNAKRIPRKIKLEYQDVSPNGDADTIVGLDSEQQAMLYETEIPMTYDDEEDIDREQFATVEVIKEDVKPFKKHKINTSLSDLAEYSVLERKNLNAGPAGYQVDVIEECESYQLQDLLVNMLIQDLRSVNTLYDPGMSQLLRTLSGAILPPAPKIESLIKEMHSDKLTTISAQIKAHSQVKPYSLGFEIWRNVEKKHFISVFFNSTADTLDSSNLLNQLYCTFEYNSFTSLDTIFAEFNLDNCSAAIVNYDYDDYLKEFLCSKKIPIIVSYDVVVDKCVRDVLALPTVSPIIDEIKEVIMRYFNEINSRDMEVPNYNEDFPWTEFELLKFFTESVAWPEDVEVLMSTAKIIVNELNTLSITLDTLKAEEIPLSSMLSPITAKVLSKKYARSDSDDSFVGEIKATITNILNTFITENDFLTVASILDPRFHRLTSISNFGKFTKILTDKHNKMCATDGFSVVPKNEEDNKAVSSGTRKSNLEIFFDIDDIANISTVATEESNVENDLKRYRKEVHVSLDESPLTWWHKMGHVYGSLRQLALSYHCVPCTVNIKHTKKTLSQQIFEAQQRFMLTGNIIDAMLFLHHNNK